MSVVALTVFSAGLTTAGPTFVAANADGNSFVNDGHTIVVVKSNAVTGVGTLAISIAYARQCEFGVSHTVAATVTINAGQTWIGPFPKSRFDDATGKVTVLFPGGVTDLVVAAVSVAATA